MDPITAIFAAQAITGIAKDVGLLRDRANELAEDIAADTRVLVMAPLLEGLDRLEVASATSNRERSERLLDEAASKLHDAALRPNIPPMARALACVTAAAVARLQQSTDEAAVWTTRAMDLHDEMLRAVYKAGRAAMSRQVRPTSVLRQTASAAVLPVAALWSAAKAVEFWSSRRAVPSEEELARVVAQAATAVGIAQAIGVPTQGRWIEVKIERRGANIVAVSFRTAT